MKLKSFAAACAALTVVAFAAPAMAEEHATAAEAEAMVKKAVALYASAGAEKAFAEFTGKSPQFIDRDLYVIAYGYDGKCLAHGSNPKLVGKDLMDVQDVDGVPYVKERVEKAKAGKPFWQDYKFSNPVSKKIEPKSTYCIPQKDAIICAGIYK